MADRTIRVNIEVKTAALAAGLKQSAQQVKGFGSRLQNTVKNNTADVDNLANSVGVMGAAATAAAGLAVKRFADFDSAMSSVKASTRAGASELSSLRDAAIDAGASTVFSATEAAEGIDNLAKAGVSTTDILGGGLTGALDLAAAGQLDVGSAAEYAATAMTQFKLEGSDVGHIADLLAAGAGKAQGDVDDMAQALDQAGLVASQTGLTIEETTGSLAAMASAGLTGSDAGTSLKAALQRLSNPTGKAGKLMDELGISAYDAQGNFVGMEALAGQMRTGMEKLTPATRNAALATIFGSDAVRTANVLYEQGAEGIGNWIDQVDDQGYAAETAAIQMDNLKGDLEGLSGALETALIKGGSGANGVLRGIVQMATSVVQAIGKIPGPVLAVVTGLTGIAGAAALGLSGFAKIMTRASDLKGSLDNLGFSTETFNGKLGKLGKVAKVAGGILAIATALETLNAATERQAAGTEEINSKISKLANTTDPVKDLFGDMVPKDSDLMRGDQFKTFLHDMAEPGSWKTIGAHASDLGVSISRVFGDKTVKWSELKTRMQQYGDALGALATTDMPQVTSAFSALYKEAGGTEQVGKDLLTAMPGLRDALIGVAEGSGLATDDATLLKIALGQVETSAEDAADGSKESADAMLQQADSASEAVDAMKELIDVQLGARGSARGFEAAIDDAKDALKENGKTLDITTAKGRANQEALDGIADSGLSYAQALRDSGAAESDVQEVLKRSRRAYIRTAESMGMSKSEAKALADEIGLIPPKKETKVSVKTEQAKKNTEKIAGAIRTIGDTLKPFKITADGSSAKKTGKATSTEVGGFQPNRWSLTAEGKPALRIGNATTDAISRLKPDPFGLSANGSSAIKTGRKTTKDISGMGATVGIDGDDAAARTKVLAFQVWAQAKSALIKITGQVKRTFTDETGDGEGAGWSGSTPRGVAAMTAAVKKIEPGARISSGYRPGARTATGYPSYHGLGRAIDIVSPNMGRTWDKLRSAFGSRAKELFYTPRGFLRNGKMGGAAAVTRRTHYSHVHLALAAGGAARGRGTGKSDEIPAWLSNGEHVLTASDVRKLGGQNAVYRLRDKIQSGRFTLDPEPTFAAGGAVGSAQRAFGNARTAQKKARKTLDARRAALRAAEKSVRLAEKAERKADKTKSNRDDKAAAKKLKAAQKKVRAAEARVKKAEAAYDKRKNTTQEQYARLGRLNEERRELGIDFRRGDIRESITGGLDSAYGVIDQMVELARSGDLTKSQAKRLSKSASVNESKLRSYYKQADALDKKLEAAQARVEDLKGISDEVKNALTGGFNLSDVTGAVNPWTGKEGPATKADYLSKAKEYASKVKTFAGKLSSLRKKGFSGVIVQEIASMGVEAGIPAADALLSMSKTEVSQMNTAYKDIETWAGKAGQYVSEGFYKGGLSAAQGLVSGLQKNQKKIEAQILKIAKSMESALKKALGIKSPSKVFRGLGQMTAEGMRLGLVDGAAGVQSAADELVPSVSPSVYQNNPHRAGAQNVAVTLDDGSLARAMNGVALTLLVDGKPVRAIVRTEVGTAVRSAADTLRGGRR